MRPERATDGCGRALASPLRLQTQEEGDTSQRPCTCLWTRPYIVKTRKQAGPSWEGLRDPGEWGAGEQGCGGGGAGRPAGSRGQSRPCSLLDLPGLKPEATRAGRYNLGLGRGVYPLVWFLCLNISQALPINHSFN